MKLAPRLTEASFDAGEVVFHKGASEYSLCHVLDGFVSASMQASNGEFAPMDIYGRGNWFGELTVFNHHPSALEYTCLTSTRVLLVSHLDAKQAYSSEPRFSKHIGNLVAWRSQRHCEMLSLVRGGNPALRAVLGLALFSESIHHGALNLPFAPESLEIPLKQSLIASICGLSRGVFSEQIHQLVADGWLSTNYSTTTLLKLQGWRNVIGTYRETRLADTKPSMTELLAIMDHSALGGASHAASSSPSSSVSSLKRPAAACGPVAPPYYKQKK